jgi:hypothetical protein
MELQRQLSRPEADQLRSNRQGLLRRAARDLLRVLDGVTGSDDPETRLALCDVAAAVEARREELVIGVTDSRMGQPAVPARLPVTDAQQGGAYGPRPRSPPRRPAHTA